jgi:MerR family transcriptional regulator, light-induced transcriptional regulator
MTFRERRSLGEKLGSHRNRLAAQVNDEFFQRHPDWRERYGEKGVQHGFEDACFHIDFLRGAIEAGSTEEFKEYVRWTEKVLGARGITVEYLAENLRQIGDAARAKLSAAESAYVDGFIDAANKDHGHLKTTEGSDPTHDLPALAVTRRLFTQAILLGQRKAAETVVMQAIENGVPLLDVYVDVLQEALFEVGRRWEENMITVAEEHMATAITQYLLAQLYPRIAWAGAIKGRIVVTGVQGELHHVGANIVADVLEANGWDVRFLGTNLPHAGILRVIEEHGADIVGISVTVLSNIPQLISLVEATDRAFGRDHVRIMVGGSAFRSKPQLWKEVGAHGFARDARQLLGVIDTLS